MQELQANMRGIQWHPRVQIPVGKRAPYTAATHDPNPDTAESIMKTRTVQSKNSSNESFRVCFLPPAVFAFVKIMSVSFEVNLPEITFASRSNFV
jgi:hypothetical protein